jgi:hypothetical protein
MGEINAMVAGKAIAEGCVAPIFKSTSAQVERTEFERISPMGNQRLSVNRSTVRQEYSSGRRITAIGLTVLAIIRVASPGMPLYESPFLKDASPRANSF